MSLSLVAMMATGPRRPSAIDIIWYCGLAWLASGGVRYVMWFALLLMPLYAEQLAALIPYRTAPRVPRAVAIGFGVALLLLVVALLPWFEPARYFGAGDEGIYASSGRYNTLMASTTPVSATEWLAQNPIDGRFWVDMSQSSYTIWRLPEKQVFTDLRVELFPPDVWRDYFAIARGNDYSLLLLDEWEITHVMLDGRWQRNLHELLLATPGWCEQYQDGRAVILARCET
ncbi:MAG: hypothetical protein HC837_20610 [Chloroflexaceae bacterium]|nr:hypothetical protein [Chloroflexaceae bacterium]